MSKCAAIAVFAGWFIVWLDCAPALARELGQSLSQQGVVADADDDSPSVESLINDLGANDFERRERAEHLLREIGLPAVDTLDLVATERSERGLRANRIARDIRRDELLRNATAAATGNVAAARRLPMWRRFQVPGYSDQLRAKHLGRMFKVVAESQSLEELDIADDLTPSERANAEVSQAFRKLVDLEYPYFDRQQRVYGALAAMLYGGHAGCVLFAEDGMTLRLLLSKAEGKNPAEEHRALVLWLLKHYVANLPNDGKVFAFKTVLDYRLPRTDEICRIVLEHGNSPNDLALAAASLAKSGNANDVELLRDYFDRDDLIRAGIGSTYQQLGPLTLLAAVLLTGQDPSKYGYNNLLPSEVTAFDYLQVRCPSRLKYDKTKKQWEHWEKLHFREEFPPPVEAIQGERL